MYYKLFAHYRKIAKKAHEGDLVAAIENLISQEEKNSLSLKKLTAETESIKLDSLRAVQKVSLIRYNPFEQTGGDQSFSLCLLDGKDNGFLLTALHTRDRTRVYTKTIVAGESKTELSREEDKLLKQAKKYE